MALNNYIDKAISSRKNSRNACEGIATPKTKRPNSQSKSMEKNKIFPQSEKKAKNMEEKNVK